MRRFIGCILLPCYVAACVSWDVQEVSPEQALDEQQAKKARITLTDGSRITLAHLSVSGDSLTGFWRDDRVSVPLARVSEVAVYDLDVVGTVVVVSLGVALLAAFIVGCAQQGGNPGFVDTCL
jgi:hypothetical protein